MKKVKVDQLNGLIPQLEIEKRKMIKDLKDLKQTKKKEDKQTKKRKNIMLESEKTYQIKQISNYTKEMTE